MSGRTLGVVALVAVVAMAVAFAVSRSPGTGARSGAGETPSVVMPALKERIGDVAAVRLSDASIVIEVRRDAQGAWRAVTLGGLPANGDAITRLIMTIANLDPGEPKTDDPSRYAEISVQEPITSPDASKAEFLDADGALIGAVIFGAMSERVIGDRFVRIVGETRARLVRVPIVVKPTVREWVDIGITRIARERVMGVTVHPIDAPPLEIEPAAPGTPSFVVKDATGTAVPANDDAAQSVTSALAWFDLEGARASTVEPDGPSVVTTTFRLHEGWSIEVRTWREGADAWARVGVIAPMTPPEGEDAARITAEIEAARARCTGWDFRIANARFESLRPTLESLTMQRTPATAP